MEEEETLQENQLFFQQGEAIPSLVGRFLFGKWEDRIGLVKFLFVGPLKKQFYASSPEPLQVSSTFVKLNCAFITTFVSQSNLGSDLKKGPNLKKKHQVARTMKVASTKYSTQPLLLFKFLREGGVWTLKGWK